MSLKNILNVTLIVNFSLTLILGSVLSLTACVPYRGREFPEGKPQERLIEPLENHQEYKVCLETSLTNEKPGVVVAIYRHLGNQSLVMKAYEGKGKYTSIKADRKLIILNKTPLFENIVTEIKSSQETSLFVQGETLVGTYYSSGNFLVVPKSDKVDLILDCK